jgi:polyhydroxybutyrate depolymerase
VHPEGLGTPQTWHFGVATEAQADLMFFRDLISYLEGQWSIDPKRIYVTGMSNGAQMMNHLGCELSDIIAAIGPVSGGYPSLHSCNPVRPMPVVAFHGTADNLIPYEGQGQILLPARERAAGWASHNGCDHTPMVTFQKGQVTGETWGNCRDGADVILYTIVGGGHSWPGSDMLPQLGITTKDINATDVIWDFFAAHPMP